ncbi:MAG: alpha/beta fold hydrolase, partial [Burkholderiales bacterium]|nr:alpha/beta fold hydrolase [Burkholderiales bacterium]
MNSATRRSLVAAPAGALECALDLPPQDAARGIALLCHPHPLHGGTMDNKVVQTLGRACVQLGYRCLRFNFRGIGRSEGTWDEGRGEVDDALAALAAFRQPGEPLVLGGFSFGGYVASQAARRLPEAARAERLILVGPAVRNFTVAA